MGIERLSRVLDAGISFAVWRWSRRRSLPVLGRDLSATSSPSQRGDLGALLGDDRALLPPLLPVPDQRGRACSRAVAAPPDRRCRSCSTRTADCRARLGRLRLRGAGAAHADEHPLVHRDRPRRALARGAGRQRATVPRSGVRGRPALGVDHGRYRFAGGAAIALGLVLARRAPGRRGAGVIERLSRLLGRGAGLTATCEARGYTFAYHRIAELAGRQHGLREVGDRAGDRRVHPRRAAGLRRARPCRSSPLVSPWTTPPLLVLEDLARRALAAAVARGKVDAVRGACRVGGRDRAGRRSPRSASGGATGGALGRSWLTRRRSSRSASARERGSTRGAADPGRGERAPVAEGCRLLHLDVRSDNLCSPSAARCSSTGTGRREGNPLTDLVAWLPSLCLEDGPPRTWSTRRVREIAALISGVWLRRLACRRRRPHGRACATLQLAQLG